VAKEFHKKPYLSQEGSLDNENLIDDSTSKTSLLGDEGISDHFLSDFLHFRCRSSELNTTLHMGFLEETFTSATSVDLKQIMRNLAKSFHKKLSCFERHSRLNQLVMLVLIIVFLPMP